MTESPPARHVLGTRVDATSYDDAARRVVRWAATRESRYVCVATVHMVMEGHDDRAYQRIVNGADLVTPDGMPLVWALRLLGVPGATRVYGPELTSTLCARAAEESVPVGFYGSSPAVVDAMVRRLARAVPGLHVAYRWCPPFRELSAEEDARVVREINASGAGILFVGLGCPKQERWMAAHRGRVRAVMVGVGAAFDFIAGAKRQAPPVVQRLGMEWCFRLLCEPRRLWKRYLHHNPRFVALLAAQLRREFVRGGALGAPAGPAPREPERGTWSPSSEKADSVATEPAPVVRPHAPPTRPPTLDAGP